ncbi:MAG: hypothetical protein ACTSU5_05605 [Promethearchaeota archaeon]
MRPPVDKRPPLDKDIFTCTGGIYQVITSTHPKGRVVSLHKYQEVPGPTVSGCGPNAPSLWQRLGTGRYYTRQIPSYSVINATENIHGNRFARESGVYRGVKMIEVPVGEIDEYFFPEGGAARLLEGSGEGLDPVETECREALECVVDHCGLKPEDLGITGSILWGGHNARSDLDIVVYGVGPTREFIASVDALLDGCPRVSPISEKKRSEIAETLHAKTGLPTGECREYVGRKKFYLTFAGKFLSVGFVPTVEEVAARAPYEQTEFNTLEPITISCSVEDDSYGYFYPGVLPVSGAEVVDDPNRLDKDSVASIRRVYTLEREISSYIVKDERVEVRGLLQEVLEGGEKFYQVYIGSRELYGNEYIRLLK